MRYQIDKGYKPLKLDWKVKIAPIIFLAGAAFSSFALGALEGAIEGWNYESMRKQALLTEKFEGKYQEAESRNKKCLIEGVFVEDYLNKIRKK